MSIVDGLTGEDIRRLRDMILEDPTDFPGGFKDWVPNWMALYGLDIPISQIVGTSLITSGPGFINMHAGAAAPDGWKLCDGSAISRTDFQGLFTVIGTTYGVGDGSTTFNLPDLRGRSPVGLGTNVAVNALGANDGVAVGNRRGTAHRHTAHGHTINDPGHVTTVHAQSISSSGGATIFGPHGVGGSNDDIFATPPAGADTTGITINTNDGGSGTATDPLDGGGFQVVNFIIKT